MSTCINICLNVSSTFTFLIIFVIETKFCKVLTDFSSSPLSDVLCVCVFSSSVGCLFVLLTVSFAVQIFSFGEVLFGYFFTLFSLSMELNYQIHSWSQHHGVFCLLSLMYVMPLDPTYKYLICFELTFVPLEFL